MLTEALLVNSPLPISLAALYAHVQKQLPRTAFSTIFRIVKQLELDGKVTKLDWRERGSVYEWSERPHHHHIVCHDCGAVQDIKDTLLNFNEHSINKKTGYEITHHSIELVGICPPCQQEVIK